MVEMFFEHREETFFCEWLWQHVVHACSSVSFGLYCAESAKLTMLEIHRDVVAANIGSHSNDGRVIKLSNQMCCRDSVQIGHDDIHKDQIILGATIQLVDSF